MTNSYELLELLKNRGYDATQRDPFWWPHSGSFEVVVGAILTQQTKWEKVEKSLDNLRNANVLDLKSLAEIDVRRLSILIKPSGFYNTKAKNLSRLSKAIDATFGSFEAFTHNVTREWLLSQKGVGEESADSILCYSCLKDELVVDSYTARLLAAFGFEFESYDALKAWMIEGIATNKKRVDALYSRAMSDHEIYARFHGKIVEYAKMHSRGKNVEVSTLID
ncbi:3-methyladenine DNA glycosylase [Sulfurospirillum sp. 1612]|uniref:3-methyladenine DNA glycosylase n=1 Tax=Sulfurospirillum sp. 1612 TaxID=3094835 RepID=UPI002F929691